jgi:hypothetical protein
MMVLSDEEIAALEEFVRAGGNIIATGRPGTMDYCGAWREDNHLENLLGIRFTEDRPELDLAEAREKNTYLRIEPAFREIPEFLRGLEDTDILAFGGCFTPVKAAAGAQICLTRIPDVRTYPPEFSWMDVEQTDEPALVTRTTPGGGRVVYLGADLDRCYGRSALPDHGQLLSNLLRWTLREKLPVRVEGPGYLDIQLYRQEHRQILHIANLSGANQWPAYFEENYPVGPLTVYPGPECALEPGETVKALVSGQNLRVEQNHGHTLIHLPQVTEHELLTWETVD